MSQYGVRSEAELISGCILKFNKFHKLKAFEVKQQVMEAVRLLRRRYLKFFEDEAMTQAYQSGSSGYAGGGDDESSGSESGKSPSRGQPYSALNGL